MIAKLIERFNNWRNRCRICEMDGIDKSFIDRFTCIEEIAQIKTVREFTCNRCGTAWVLAERLRFLSKVVRNDLFARWKTQPWMPNVAQEQVLNEIVGVPDYDQKNLYFPCAIRTRNGAIAQRAIVIATTGDCFGSWPFERDIAILDGSHELSPSPFALPADVRAATMVAPERSRAMRR